MKNNILKILKTKRSVPKLTRNEYPIHHESGKDYIVDDYGGKVAINKLAEMEVEVYDDY